jgi:hypothetical protein
MIANRKSVSMFFLLGMVGLTMAKPEAAVAQSAKKSTLCQFTAGPRQGETQDYAPMDPIPVGSACNDGAGSTGRVIAPKSGGSDSIQKSTVCQFTAGPRKGEAQDYAPRDPIPVGSACNDGAGSTGRVIAKSGGSKSSDSTQKSTLCKFTAGPRKGETEDYAPRDPIPVGSACNDGAGSSGRVIASKD